MTKWSLAGVMMLGAWATPASMAGQVPGNHDPEIRELRERIDHLVPRLLELAPLAEAETSSRARRRAQELGVRTDTSTVGALTVVALAEQRDLVRGAVADAFAPYRSILLGAEHVVNGTPWGVQLFERMETELGIWEPGVRQASAPVSGGRRMLTRRVSDMLGQAMADALPLTVRQWAGTAPLVRPGPTAPYSMEDLYRLGVASGSFAVSDCLGGDAHSCWSVLGFATSEVPAFEWYSTDELRSRAHRSAGLWSADASGRSSPREAVWDLSVDQRMDLCIEGDALACSLSLGPAVDQPPLPRVARTSLLEHALRVGGEGSFARLLDSRRPDVRGLLEDASGQEADALVLDWARALTISRPVTHDDLGAASALSLLWLLAFGGAAAAGAGRRVS